MYGIIDVESLIVDLDFHNCRTFLDADHKHAKKLLQNLESKLSLEVVRQLDYRRTIPTQYRVYNYSQILERRRAANMVWVLRTRSVSFVDIETVNKLIIDQPMGQLDLECDGSDPPMGRSPMLYRKLLEGSC
jgi:hypothetical protein